MGAAESVPCRGTTSSGRRCKRTVSPNNPLYERGICGRCSGSVWGAPEDDVDVLTEHPLDEADLADRMGATEWGAIKSRLTSQDSYYEVASVLAPFSRQTKADPDVGDLANTVWVGPVHESAPLAMLATNGRCAAFSFTAPLGLGDDDAHCLRGDNLRAIQQMTGPSPTATLPRKRVIDQDEWFRVEQMLEAAEEYFYIEPHTGGLTGVSCGTIATLPNVVVLDELLQAAHQQITEAWTPSTGVTKARFADESAPAFLVEARIDRESGEPMGVGIACSVIPGGATAPGPRLVLGGDEGYLRTVCMELDVSNRLQHPEPHAVAVNIRDLQQLRDAARALNARGFELGLPRPTSGDWDFMEPGTTVAPAYCSLSDDVSVVISSVFEETF